MGTYYRINGAIYIQIRDLLMNGESIYCQGSFAYVMDKKHSVDIDDEMDFLFAQTLLANC